MPIPLDAKGLPLWEVREWNDAPVRLELQDHAALDQLLASVPIASFNREQIGLVYTTPKSFHLVFEPRVTPEEAARLTAAGYDFERLPDLDRAGPRGNRSPLGRRGGGRQGLRRLPRNGRTTPPIAQIGAQLAQLEPTIPISAAPSPGASRSRAATCTASSSPTTWTTPPPSPRCACPVPCTATRPWAWSCS